MNEENLQKNTRAFARDCQRINLIINYFLQAPLDPFNYFLQENEQYRTTNEMSLVPLLKC